MRFLTVGFFFLVVSVLYGDFKAPPEVKGEVGDFISVTVEGDWKTVKWFTPDTDLKLFPPSMLKGSRSAVVISQKPGLVS